jgi:hypothetical protein
LEDPIATQRDRDEKKRQEKQEAIKQQVADGSLVIRKMTPAERKANPPRPRKEGRKRPRGR